jgi:alkylation response protein AidB-like acyl-CoA dehydrogenase
MDLEFEPEHVDLQQSARGLLARHAPFSLCRSFHEGRGDHSELWDAVRAVGWLALGSASQDDDLFGTVGAAIVAAEIGARAAPLPFAEHVFVSRVAQLPGARGLAAALASGAPMATCAVLEAGSDWSLRGLTTRAVRAETGWVLHGEKTGVPFGRAAGITGVVAVDPDDLLGLFFVSPEAGGTTWTSSRAADPSRAMTGLVLAETPVAHAITGAAADAAIREALLVAAVVTAAEALGGAQCLLELAVQYAKERRQFGVPIGTFQALQHLLADLHVIRATTWASVIHTTAALDDGGEDARHGALVTAAYAARATRAVGEGALQVLGGVGFTAEHDASLLFARVLDCEQRFGDAITHEAALLSTLRSRGAVAALTR